MVTLRKIFIEYCNHILEGGYDLTEENRVAVKKIFDAVEGGRLGVTLIGNSGAGKTFVFDVLQRILAPSDPRKFLKVPALNVANDFGISGYDAFLNHRDRDVLYDDLGAEPKVQYFGNNIEVFEVMIQRRYDLWKSHGIRTYYTTNLRPEELKSRYGERSFNRLRESTASVVMPPADYRGRKNFKGFVPVVHPPTKEEQEWIDLCLKRQEEAQNRPQKTKGAGMGERLREYWDSLKEGGDQ